MTKRSLPAVVLLIGLGAARAAQAGPPIDLQGARVVDLTHPFDDQTIYWPTSPSAFQLNRLSYGKTEGGWFYASNSFCAPEHGGTHLDAPIHFAAGKRTTDQIPVEQLIGDRRLGDRAAHEDRRRLGRAGADRGTGAEEITALRLSSARRASSRF